MMMAKTLGPDANKLQALCTLPAVEALPQAAAFLADLVQDHSFLESHVLPFLEEAQSAEEWYVARRWDAPDGSYSLRVFVWPPGTRTRIHDHSSWGAYACAAGTVLEESYERLDDGSRCGHARLEGPGNCPGARETGPPRFFPAAGASIG